MKKTIDSPIEFSTDNLTIKCNAELTMNEHIFNGEFDQLKTMGDTFVSFVLDIESSEFIDMLKNEYHTGEAFTVKFYGNDDRLITIKSAGNVASVAANTGKKSERIPTERGCFCPQESFSETAFVIEPEEQMIKRKFQNLGA